MMLDAGTKLGRYKIRSKLGAGGMKRNLFGVRDETSSHGRHLNVIISFKHKGLRDFFETNSKRGIPGELSTRLRDRLDVIDAASTLADPRFATLRLA